MTAKSKLDGKDIYWCKEDYDWKYEDTKKPIEKIYQIDTYSAGEDLHFVKTLTKEECDVINKITGGDAIEDIDPDHPITIKMVSNRQERESSIAGLMFGDGIDREEAEKIVDSEK